MNYSKMLAAASAALFLMSNMPVHAQGDDLSMDEIKVSARKREENLMDVPVSSSVITDVLINEAGITDLYDLFEMIPGIHYDEEGDRLAALPSIRGVQANDVASNRTKVTAFIDGIPVLGSIGSIGFNGFKQVEVYRGPQSAAFGRSTFAGAINYVTKDPGEVFGGEVGFNISDYGTQILTGSLDVPVTETFGFLLNASIEDSGAPDEYRASGSFGTRDIGGVVTNAAQSDGTEYGARSGENISAKLVFEPSDDLKVSFSYGYVATDDQQAAEFYLTEEARNACFNQGGLYASAGMMAPYLVGEMNCDWDNVRANYVQHDAEAWLLANQPYLDYLVGRAESGIDATDMGMGAPVPAGPVTLANGTTLSVEEQILLMARAYSIPQSSRGTESNRDRLTFQIDKEFANDSAIQFSFMQSDEKFLRAQSRAFFYYDPDNIGIVDDGVPNSFDLAEGPLILFGNDMGMGPSDWNVLQGMGYPFHAMPSTGEIGEQYAEIRWVSPGAERLRWVVGASYYEYDYLEERWNNDMNPAHFGEGISYAAQLNGVADEFMELSGLGAAGIPYAPDNEIIGEDAKNMAAFFNVDYDLTERLTLSVEGRYQSDKVGATNRSTGLSEEVTTDSFVPRVSMTFNATDTSSYYLQWAKGVNPAGINVGVLNSDTLNVLGNGVENGLIPFSAALNADNIDNTTGDPVPDGIIDAYDNTTGNWYTDGSQTTPLTGNVYQTEFVASDFTSYREEEMDQFEFGFKGSAFDGRLTYAGALYWIEWTDQIQNGAIDLGSPCESGADAGDPTVQCTLDGQQYFYVAGSAGTLLNAGLNFGDVNTYGAEIEGNFRISDNWNIRAQASVLRAEYDQFCDIALYANTDLSLDTQYLDPLNLTIRTPGPNDTIASTCYVTDGNDVAGQPSFSGSISPDFNTDIAGMRFSARLDIRHEGSQYENSGNFNEYPAVTTANLSLGLAGERWSTTLYVNNLTDENSPRRIFGGGDDTSQMGLIGQDNSLVLTDFLGDPIPNALIVRDNFVYQPRVPRTIGLRGVYRF